MPFFCWRLHKSMMMAYLVVFLLFGSKDVGGRFASHGAEESVSASELGSIVDSFAEGGNLWELGSRCVVDVGNVNKEGFTIGGLNGHIDSEAFAVSGTRPQEVL